MPTKTTELEAVNTILAVAGEPPINSLTGPQGSDATIARNILTEASREVQNHGWNFNTLYNQTLSPNDSNEIVLADEVLRVDNDPTSGSNNDSISTLGSSLESREVIQRGDKLFDKTNNTFTFNESIRLTVVYLYTFEELPEPARRYITIRAARMFQDRMVGSQLHSSFVRADEANALANLKEFEGDTADRTIFDNSDVFNTINRRGGLRGGGY